MKTTSQLSLLVLMTMLTACGASKSKVEGNTNQSSSATVNKPTSSCNQASGAGFTAKLKSYVDSSGATRYDYTYAMITAVASDFTSTSNRIQMYRWMANASSGTSLDSTALQFALLDTQNNSYIGSWRTSLKWSDVSSQASTWGTDVNGFFARVKILVNIKDSAGNYDALKISYYNSSNTALGMSDQLLPPFSVNPNDYALEPDGSARAAVLKSLHPFASKVNSGWTTAQYQSMAANFCF